MSVRGGVPLPSQTRWSPATIWLDLTNMGIQKVLQFNPWKIYNLKIQSNLTWIVQLHVWSR
jgi:hypothetical protein